MTKQEFLKECRKTKGWELTPNKMIRNRHWGCCPLTKIAHKNGFQFFHNKNWNWAAEYIGVKLSLAKRIVVASDGEPTALRKELLKACGLKDV